MAVLTTIIIQCKKKVSFFFFLSKDNKGDDVLYTCYAW